MQHDTAPNPHRFQTFTQIANGKGFKIKGSKYIYFFDKYGGWYDEFNNYYSPDGESEDPPVDEDQDFQRVLLENQFLEGADDDDYYDQLYGGNPVDDYEENTHVHTNSQQKVLESIVKNNLILDEYNTNTPVRIDFFNINFKTNKIEILKHYRSKIGNTLLNVILHHKNGSFSGQGYFVCKDVSVAKKLIKYEGEEFLGRKVSFDVEPFEQNLADPIKKDQFETIAFKEDDFEPLVKEKPAETKDESSNLKKKYFSKNQTKNEPKKGQQKPSQVQKTQQPKKQVKTQVKVVEQKPKQVQKEEKKEPTWGKYHGEMTMFPKKESFREWMQTFGFKQNEHFKNLTKVESKDATKRFATVELRSDAFEKIQGKQYENKKVSFEKVN